MKKSIAIALFILCIMTAPPLNASPLYGGYNGQGTFWVDLVFFGIDDQIRWWVRVPVDLVTGFLRVNFIYESSGAISAEIAGYNILGDDNLRAGIDTAGVVWFELSELGVSGGADTNGNSWAEQTFLEYLGTGSDSNDRLWGFATYDYFGYRLKAGIDLSFLVAPPEESITNLSFPVQSEPQDLPRLSRMLQKEESAQLMSFLASLANDDRLREKVEGLASLNLESLLKIAEEEVFTQNRRRVIGGMMRGLIDPAK